MNPLRYLLFAALLFLTWWTLRTAIWQGHYTAGGGTYIVTLPENAIWNPPAVPAYSEFTSTFDSLPTTQPKGSMIYRVLKWDWMLLEFMLYCLGAFCLIAPVYLLTRRSRPDVVLHIVSCIGIGLLLAALLCFIIWLAIGGWGPPAPLFFAMIGLGGGALFGVMTRPMPADNQAVHRSGEVERF